jgi:DNA polymerase III alpha subunit (gram-positive type)
MKYYVISFDVESTGLSTYGDQIVEFGAVFNLWDAETGVSTVLPQFVEHAKPTHATMSKKAEEITGISMVSLKDKQPIQKVLNNFMLHVDTVCVDSEIPRLLLSYNGFGYDIPMLVAEIERYGDSAIVYFRKLRIQNAIDVLLFGRSCIDTSILSRKANGSCSYRLGDVYASVCKCPLTGAHGAISDSQAVLDILKDSEIQVCFQTLVAEAPENNHCQNPMAIVRTCVGRIASRAAGLGKKKTSKRVLDMVQTHTEKKRKRIE